MKIQKVQILKDDRICIQVIQEKNGKEEEITLKSDLEPAEGFHPAVDALKSHACEIMEFVKGDETKTTITAVTFKETGDLNARGAQIVFNRVLARSDAPVKITTPLKFMDKPAEDSPDSVLFSKACIAALKKLLTEAEEYYNGNGLEQDMFTNTDDDEGAAEKEPE